MAISRFLSSSFLLLTFVGVVYGEQAPLNKNNEKERELKTFVDRTKKMLLGHDCVPVSDQYQSEIFTIVKELSDKCGINTPEVFVVDPDSSAGTALLVQGINFFNNAYVYSEGRIVSMIIIDTGLVDILTKDELRSIIAHELSHILYKCEYGEREARLRKICTVCSLGAAIPLYVYAICIASSQDIIQRFKSVGASVGAVSIFGAALLFAKWRKRCEEKAADLNALILTQDKTLASALEKMHARDAEFYPVSVHKFEWWEKWFPYILDHPTLRQRKNYIEKYEIPVPSVRDTITA